MFTGRTLFPTAPAGATLTLPVWRLVGTDAKQVAVSAITALTYTIYQADTVVGASDRDGLGAGSGANGIAIDTTTGEITHELVPGDNALATAALSERRQVVYKVTYSGGKVHYRTVDYWLFDVRRRG